MWKVFFEKVEVFTSKTDVEALQFALSLHQASNSHHVIYVTKPHPDKDGVVPLLLNDALPGDKVLDVDAVVCILTRE